MRDRVIEVMAAVFAVSISDISEDMTLGHSRNWDSLKHMNLIMALEEEFGVSFTNDDVVEMISFPLILEVLRGKEIS